MWNLINYANYKLCHVFSQVKILVDLLISNQRVTLRNIHSVNEDKDLLLSQNLIRISFPLTRNKRYDWLAINRWNCHTSNCLMRLSKTYKGEYNLCINYLSASTRVTSPIAYAPTQRCLYFIIKKISKKEMIQNISILKTVA